MAQSNTALSVKDSGEKGSGGKDPDGDKPFAFGALLTDKRYRGYTFQFIAILILIAFFSWLASNAISNLGQQGQDISYRFLNEPAGYDINQTLIDYTSRSTHLRASFVGVLNTLLVAILGCIAATVIGVVAGILRLSKNWLIAKFMSLYVEIFRNVPILIWILIIFSVMGKTLPASRSFRGENPEHSMWFDAVALTNQGLYIPSLVFEQGSFWLLLALCFSVVCVVVFSKYAKAHQMQTGHRLPVLRVNVLLLLLPPLLVFFLTGRPIGLDYPVLGRFNFQGGLQLRISFLALWFALSVYTAAFIAENVRAGILSVSKGQSEAAAALGLKPNRIMRLVVLPQALRVIIPPLISHYLNLTKNSSLAIAVGYMDITATLGGITLNQTGRAIEAILLLMLFYLAISLSISFIMNIYNDRVKLKER